MHTNQSFKHKYISTNQLIIKRIIDLVAAIIGIAITLPVLILLWIISSISTQSNGILIQERIGRYGKSFKLFKFKTMQYQHGINTHITTASDPRITPIGRILRKSKLDELPQLINVLIGDMSLVGPRPDVPGYADLLKGTDQIILTIRPGITGPATIYYHNEEELLAQQPNPVQYNDQVIWPHKVRINKQYIQQYSLYNDIKIIIKTIFK